MKNFMFVMMMLAFSSIACIEDGSLPPEETQDAVPTSEVDATVVFMPDAHIHPPMEDAALPAVDAVETSEPDAYEPPPPVDAAIIISDAATMPPDAALIPVDASVPMPDAYEPPSPVDAAVLVPDALVLPASVMCHGLVVSFSTADVAGMHHCTGWSASGSAAFIPPQTEIIAADGICAVTCNRGESGDTVVPNQCSGIWLPGCTAEVPRWYTAGCRRLPDHPPAEPDQAGCTWDGRCDLF